jgi:hypothetical protein
LRRREAPKPLPGKRHLKNQRDPKDIEKYPSISKVIS